MRRSVVVQHDPQLRKWLILGIVLGFLVMLALGGYVGRVGAFELYQALFEENDKLRTENQALLLELDELRQWQTNRQTREEVSRVSLGMVREELTKQQELIAELEQGVRFYRSLMATEEQAEGLSVRSIGLVAGSEPGRYLFRILVQQNARKHNLLTGVLRIELVGMANGESRSYTLASLSAELPAADIKLRFKYFQAIEGEMTLPAGFVPNKIIASAKAAKPRQIEVSRDFPWLVQERIVHVGK